MRGQYTAIVLVIVNVVILGVLGFFYFQKDRTAPEIVLGNANWVYEEGMEDSVLLEDVLAYDEEDGDITSNVIVEKVVTDTQKEQAIITYGVADEAGNTIKATRTVEMLVTETSAETEALNSQEESAEEINGEEESTEEETNEEESTEETAEEEETEEDSEEEETEEESTEEAEESQPAAQAAPVNVGIPTIKFRDTKVRCLIGNLPAWVDSIEGLYDDTDDYVTLLGSIQVNGLYDRNTPGSYNVEITVTDTEGNTSVAYPVEIIVHE